MAEQVEGFEFVDKGGGALYPWHEWMDGSTWKLTPGEDFAVSVRAFRTNAYYYGQRHGYRVRVNVRDGFVYLRAES